MQVIVLIHQLHIKMSCTSDSSRHHYKRIQSPRRIYRHCSASHYASKTDDEDDELMLV